MAGTSTGAAGRRRAVGLALLAGLLILAVVGRIWEPPPANPAGVAWLVLCGLVLGVAGLVTQPGWRLRAAGAASLALAGLALNLAWLPALESADENIRLRAQPDASLARRFHDHHHYGAQRNYGYFLLGESLVGKPLRIAEGVQLLPWRLLALGRASEIVEIPAPGRLAASPAEVVGGQEHRVWAVQIPDNKKRRVERYTVVAVTQGAEDAEYFVAFALDGMDFLVPDALWKKLGLRAILRERRGREQP